MLQLLDGRNIHDGSVPQPVAQWDAMVGFRRGFDLLNWHLAGQIRIIPVGFGSDHWRSPSANPCQGRVTWSQVALGCLQRRRLQALPGQLFHSSATLYRSSSSGGGGISCGLVSDHYCSSCHWALLERAWHYPLTPLEIFIWIGEIHNEMSCWRSWSQCVCPFWKFCPGLFLTLPKACSKIHL